MYPAYSAYSLRPFLTRTSLVIGKATRRSPIAVSPRIVPIVMIERSMAGGSTRAGDGITCDGWAGAFFERVFLEVSLGFTRLAGFAFFACFLFVFRTTALFFPDMLALA